MQKKPEEIAAGLSRRERDLLIDLDTFSRSARHRPDSDTRVARALSGRGLVRQRGESPTGGRYWSITTLGRQVATVLRGEDD